MRQIVMSIILVCLAYSFSTHAQTANANLLKLILDLPSPPPMSNIELNGLDKNERVRSTDFYLDKNIPKDDAPIEDLADYWENKNNRNSYNKAKIKISEKSAERLLEFAKENPPKLKDYLNILPTNEETAEKIKDIFDSSQNAEGIDESWKKEVRKWLKFKSKFYLNELASEASQAKDHKSYKSVIKDDQLKALAKLDWDLAEPILEKLEDDRANPISAVFAKRLFYENALKNENSIDIEKYRSILKKIVEDKNATGNERDGALDALVLNEVWDGSVEWFLSLFEDKTLFELSLGEYAVSHPLNGIISKDPDKWIPIAIKLVGNENRVIHNAVVQALAQFNNRDARKDALIPLLPWISNPKWADTDGIERLRLIQSMSFIQVPESVLHLIWAVENDKEYGDWAADALIKYKDPRAIPALKIGLKKTTAEDERQRFYRAILASGGFSAQEQLEAIEAYAEKISTPEGFKEVEENYISFDDLMPLKISKGKFFANQKEPNEGLVNLAIERQKVLKTENPPLAKIFSSIMQRWQGRIIALQLLQQIENGTADVETILGVLARRAEFRKNLPNYIYAIVGKSGLANGISACLSEKESDLLNVLGSSDVESVISVLACARLIRAELPSDEVGVLINSQNELLALAAERYLISQDSPKSRKLVYAKHPNKALILGAVGSFNPANYSLRRDWQSPLQKLFISVGSYFSGSRPEAFKDFEEKLQKEILEDKTLIGIYAHLTGYSSGHQILRIYETHATFTYHPDEASVKTKKVKKEDLDKFFDYLREIDIETLRPVRVYCHHNCLSREFITLGRNGGHRIYSSTGRGALKKLDSFATFFPDNKYERIFHFEKHLNDLEKIYSDAKFQIKTFWKNSEDIRILVEDKEKESFIEKEIEALDKIDDANEELDYEQERRRRFERRAERKFEHFEWRELKDGKLGKNVSEPNPIPFLKDRISFPPSNELNENEKPWQSQIDNHEIRAGEYNKGGLWKINRSGSYQILKGLYSEPIVTPDKNWVVVSATDNESWAGTDYFERINLRTNKRYKINLPEADYTNVLSFVPAHNKVLIQRAKDTYYGDTDKDNPSPKTPIFYLLDAATGTTEIVKGEFLPLMQQTFRPLQPTGNPNEFWAAIPSTDKTEIGRYNEKDFSFKAILTIPQIALTSMEIWIDEDKSKVYFIYDSHLLSLPLPKQ